MTTEPSIATQSVAADAGAALAHRLLERRRRPGVIDLAHARGMARRGLRGAAGSTLLARLAARRGAGETMIAGGELVLTETRGEAAAVAEAVAVPVVAAVAVASGIGAAGLRFTGEMQGTVPVGALAASAGLPVHRAVAPPEAARPVRLAEAMREPVGGSSAHRAEVMPAPPSPRVPGLAPGQAAAPDPASGSTPALVLAPMAPSQQPVPVATSSRAAVFVPAESTADPATVLPPLPDAAPVNHRHESPRESMGGAMQLPVPPSAPQQHPLRAVAESAAAAQPPETLPTQIVARGSLPPQRAGDVPVAAPSGAGLAGHTVRRETRLSLVRAELASAITGQEPLTLAAGAAPASAVAAAPAEGISGQAGGLDPRREPSRIEPVAFPARADAAASRAEEQELTESETRRLAEAVGRSLERSLMRARERRGERSWKN